MAHLISFEHVTVGYGRKVVLRDLSFEIAEGEMLGLVGPNGGGKTTLLRTALRVLTPIAGRVIRHRPGLRIGYVPQRTTLDGRWPLRTLDVVLMGLFPEIGPMRRPSKAHLAEAADLLDYVALGDQAEQDFGTLSGGQRQRALLARALVTKPDVLVLDEPTAGLDVAGTGQLLQMVRDLHGRQGLTVLLSSHDLNTVANHVQRVALVLPGAFRIGPTSSVLTSESLTNLYGVAVEVDHVDGRAVIFAADGRQP